MFFFWNANAARANVVRYERKNDRSEFKDIIRAINVTSKDGCSWLDQCADISENNLKKLKNLGYRIDFISNSVYRIFW